MSMRGELIFLFSITLISSCMAKTYHDEMQTEVETLKISTKNIDERYNSKFEILSEKIKGLSSNLKAIEKILNQNRADTDVMLEDLRVETQSLKGNIEEIAHKVSLQENNLNKSISDMDARVSELENKFEIILSHLSKLQSILQGEGKTAKEKELSSNDISEYDSIVKILTVDKNFNLASEKFKNFISKYPTSSLVDNAQYWLAECYYAKGDFKSASTEFQKLIANYPTSEKKCGSLLKQSFALAQLKEIEKSKKLLKDVINQCPETTEAKMAIEKLNPSRSKERAPTKKSPR